MHPASGTSPFCSCLLEGEQVTSPSLLVFLSLPGQPLPAWRPRWPRGSGEGDGGERGELQRWLQRRRLLLGEGRGLAAAVVAVLELDAQLADAGVR